MADGNVGRSGVVITQPGSNVAEVVTSQRNRAVVILFPASGAPVKRVTNRPRDRHGGLES